MRISERKLWQKVVLLIDEFDGIPQAVVSDFLYALRHIYLSRKPRCLHSVGIVGVKSIMQLDYDRSVSPFNIQDEFRLSNFTLEQVQELLRFSGLPHPHRTDGHGTATQ